MPRVRKDNNGKTLFKRVRKPKLKYITILPSLITILNGVCGFNSIILASEGQYTMAGYMILVAMIADMLDGRVARKIEGISNFGGQLDSLCDVISFGIAPAFLMLKVMESELNLEFPGLLNQSFLHRFIWVAAITFTCCTVIRLARFNVENEQTSSNHMSFVGLPSPAAAGVVVSLILLQQRHTATILPVSRVLVLLLPFVALAVAILMISRIRYPHILNQSLSGKKPFAHFIALLLLLSFVILYLQLALVVIFWAFAAGSFIKWLINRLPVLQGIRQSLRQFLAKLGTHKIVRN